MGDPYVFFKKMVWLVNPPTVIKDCFFVGLLGVLGLDFPGGEKVQRIPRFSLLTNGEVLNNGENAYHHENAPFFLSSADA